VIPSTPAILAREARVRYAGEVETSLSLRFLALPPGCRIAIIGANGAGKSTLLRAVAGLLPLESGTLEVLGGTPEACRCRIAYVPQSRDVDAKFPVTVYDVVMMGRDPHLKWPRFPRAHDREIVKNALHTLEIENLAARSLTALSGGQRQRVFLARALAHEAELFLLDEPFVGIDSVAEAIIHRVIRGLTNAGKTVVVATHDLASLSDRFDFVALLARPDSGESLIVCGTPGEVLCSECHTSHRWPATKENATAAIF
jgi:ABC-type Mn2+/Zn2+ transport system ATPase subunit